MPTSFANYDGLPIGVAAIDANLVVRGWNATLAQWSRIPASEACGRRLPELFPTFDLTRFERRLKCVFDHEQSVVLSATMTECFLPLRQTSGRPLLHRVRLSPTAHAEAGDADRLALLTVEDVTHTIEQLQSLRDERRRLCATEASLRQQQTVLEATNTAVTEARRRAEFANRAKSAFLANMSHEIRTPLTAINGFAQIVCDYSDDPFVLDAGQRVLRNGEHLLSVVNDILDLSKIEAGRLQIDQQPCDPRAIVESVVETLEAQATGKGLAVWSRCDPKTPHVVADSMRLRQVLLNLVGNAIKFTATGSIEVKTRPCEDGVEFAVVDTGNGVPADKLEKVFEPFTQADDSAERRYGGTGLGLAICRRLVEQMDGEVAVESQVGVGSRFVVTMRSTLARETVAPAPEETAQPGEAVNERPLRGLRIYVAEDGPDNQRLFEFLLERAGAHVEMFGNGKLAVEAVLAASMDKPVATPVDLVVLDMQMPVMDGYTAATRLREADHTGPILALTAHAMDGDRQRALDAGCDAYAAKPINPATLIATCYELATGSLAPA
ncbi:MAG: ATP-binding protein [Planctomycetota bacterium]